MSKHCKYIYVRGIFICKSMTNNHTTRHVTRRKVLTGIGVGSLSLSSASSVSAESRREAILKRAIKIRQKTGDLSLYKKYLRKNNFSIATREKSYTVPRSSGSDDGFSTQYLDRNDLNISIDITKYANEEKYSFSLWWDWSREGIDDWGEPPRDIVGFYWEDSDWDVADAALYTSSKVYFEGFSDTHSSFEFNDSEGDGGAEFYAYIDLIPVGSSSPSYRQVGGEYTHTYDGVKINSVSGGFPAGISLDLSNNNKQWDNSYDENGDPLLISQSDV